MSTTGLLVLLSVCIILSGIFSATETAFSSCNSIRLKSLAQDGNLRAQKVLDMVDRYDEFLSTILIGNNVVNIGASAIATVLFVRAMGDIGATWATLVLTVVILIFGEVSPKSIAKERPESFAMTMVSPVRGLMVLLTPLNKLFSWWTGFLARVFKVQNQDEVTEGEFLTMVDEAESGGGIDREDTELIHSVLEFNDTPVSEIFTPRVDIVALPLKARKQEIMETFREYDYSRIPLYDENIDDIIGFIHLKDFYDEVWFGDKTVADILNPVIFLPPTMKISKVLEKLQQKQTHLAIVADEFGGTDGLITMEDILEELVGEIYDEHDEVEKEIVKTGRMDYIVRCTCELDKMFERFGLGEPESESNTVGGWLLEQFGEIPSRGDTVRYRNLQFTVLLCDERKIDQVRVKVMEHEDTDH